MPDSPGNGEHDPDEPAGNAESAVVDIEDVPIEGQVMLIAGAKASVPPERLPGLLTRAQADLGGRVQNYRLRYELVAETDEYAAFFVPTGHWGEVGERLGLDQREADALRRTHEEQLRRLGRRSGRREEFDSALEIREAAVVGL
ncbi:hypothetical protein [Haloprofundus salinisoli]|uniref:hypothetical protein n=1 Tax=Haloprofundus salinisoli TaxID=2876193 RepID=UPI001CCBC680|nr:hypothetical protein [Haloprofundus salinisoli]